MKPLFALIVFSFLTSTAFAQQNIGFDFTIGTPITIGRPKPYQLLLDLANERSGFTDGDITKFSPVNAGIIVGMLVDTHDGEWKWGLNIQRTAYKTSFGRNNSTQPELAQYKLRYWSMGFDVAKRIKEVRVAGRKTKLYFVSGLYFGSSTSESRIGKGGDWQKQWSYSIATVYDKSGLISWNNGLLAEVSITDFLYFYPRLSYQLAISGEEGPAGLMTYVGYNGGNRYDDVNKRLNRLYLELSVGVRLGEPLKKALSL